MNSIPADSRSSRASATSSTRNPATGPASKCSCPLSPGPNTSTLSPLGSSKTVKSGTSCTARRPRVSLKNLTVSSKFRVRVPSQTSPLALMDRIPSPRGRDERAGLVAAARQVAREKFQETGHALSGEWAVADVLVGEGFLLHTGLHVAGIHAVDAQVGVLGGEDVGELFQRGLARPVAAPAFVRLDGGVARHVDDAGILLQFVPECLDEREGRECIRPVDLLQHVERVA